MSAELRELRGRVSAQERIMTSLSVSIEEVADQLQENTVTMATKEDIKQFSDSVDARFNQVDDRLKQFSDSVDDRFTQVDDRFTHVYGVLADIQANVGEIRNILATLVAKLERK